MNGKEFALGQYRVGKLIARGGFGYVYSGETPDGKEVAIKYERTYYPRITRPHLKHEADVYRLLEGNPCVPTVYAYDRDERWNIMVFDMLGESLQRLFEKCGKQFTLKTTLMLAVQMLECVEYMHNKGIVHRDIKPDNFLMGRGENVNAVHIIDFGLARRYKRPDTGEHFPYIEGHGFFGTTRYASLNAQLGRSQSRRDDLESLAYALIQFLRGRLPWQSMHGGTEKHREQRILEKKKSWTPERLCQGLPNEFETFLAYAKNLAYEEEPDYAYLKDLFRKLFDKQGFELDYDYDWFRLPQEKTESSAKELSAAPVSAEANIPEAVEGPSPAEAEIIAEPADTKSAPDDIPASSSPSTRSNKSGPPADLPVQSGSFVLLKILARPTLEFAHPLWDAAGPDSESDNSYCHQPTLSKPEWKFAWRPAIVTNVSYGTGRCRLTVVPLMVRPNGLADIPERRHKCFVHVATGKPNSAGGGDVPEVTPMPAWPLEGTYCVLQYEEYTLYIDTDDIRKIEVQWSLDAEQLELLKTARNLPDAPAAIYDLKAYEDDGDDTRFVKKNMYKVRAAGGNTIFGDIMSLKTVASDMPDVDMSGANGFLPETFKIEERREKENGGYTTESGNTTAELEENVSLFTGPQPGNRRKSCTLAIDPTYVFAEGSLESSATEHK